jgi:RimJ/RimL family protein N-acetyltransferase
MPKIILRNVLQSDLSFFYQYQLNEEAIKMTSFPPRNEQVFYEHWKKILINPNIRIKSIIFNDKVAGSILSFEMEGQREVGYWLGQEFWGKGIATEALKHFLVQEQQRPLFAHIAKHNLASKRVLEKCGFNVIGKRVLEKCGFNVIGETKWKFTEDSAEVDEFILQLLQ